MSTNNNDFPAFPFEEKRIERNKLTGNQDISVTTYPGMTMKLYIVTQLQAHNPDMKVKHSFERADEILNFYFSHQKTNNNERNTSSRTN